MTRLIYRPADSPVVILETERDWAECMDYVRQHYYGDMPARDERFEAAITDDRNRRLGITPIKEKKHALKA